MQTAERERLELEFKPKARDFQFQSKELNESKAVLIAKCSKAEAEPGQGGEEVIKTGNFDLVLERGAVIDVKPQFDITRPGYRAHEQAALIMTCRFIPLASWPSA